MALTVMLILLFVFMLAGVPIGFAIGGSTIAAIYFFTAIPPVTIGLQTFAGINSFTIVAIPFFMLAGVIMARGGIARRIVNFANSLIDFVTGAVGCVAILASIFFGTVSGSGMATASAIGGMMIPELKRAGYNPAYAATLVCFGGIVGPVLPPSLAFVIYGSVTNVSIARLFLAGILPGLLLGLIVLCVNIWMCKRMGTDLRKYHQGEMADEVVQVPMLISMKNRAKRVAVAFKDGIWALLAPLIILGGIYSGIFTPTEAACVSVVYAFLVSVFIYKEMGRKDIYETILDAAVLNGITSFLLAYSTVFSTFMAFERVPQRISIFLDNLTDNPIIIMLTVNLIILIIGLVLDLVPAIIIMAPLMLPTVVGIGVDPIHFGVIMAANLAIGLCTPPYGCNLFVGAAVAKIKMETMLPFTIPFLIATIAGLMIITFVPWLSMVFV